MRPSLLSRLGDLAYRRRWRVVVAWIALFVAVLAIVPRFAGEFSVEFGTPGSESKEAADLIDAHFPASSGESVNVVWESAAGARSAQPRIDRFVAQASRIDGIGDVSPPRYSEDGTIGLQRLELSRPSWELETEPGSKLIELAEETSGPGLRIELGGNLISSAEEGAPPELVGLLARNRRQRQLRLRAAAGSRLYVDLDQAEEPVDERLGHIDAANPLARTRLTAFFARGGGYLGAGANGGNFLTTGAELVGLTALTRSGNGRSGILYWENSLGAASPIVGAYPTTDTLIADPPTWFSTLPETLAADARPGDVVPALLLQRLAGGQAAPLGRRP